MPSARTGEDVSAMCALSAEWSDLMSDLSPVNPSMLGLGLLWLLWLVARPSATEKHDHSRQIW